MGLRRAVKGFPGEVAGAVKWMAVKAERCWLVVYQAGARRRKPAVSAMRMR